MTINPLLAELLAIGSGTLTGEPGKTRPRPWTPRTHAKGGPDVIAAAATKRQRRNAKRLQHTRPPE